MRIPRVYVPNVSAHAGQLAEPLPLPEPASRHVSTVLRLKVGAPLVIFDGCGQSYDATLSSARRSLVSVEIEGRSSSEPLPRRPIVLAVCIARGERMDISVQKATELGASVIQPIVSDRTVVRIDPRKAERKRMHWQAVMIAACEQCGRSRLAEVPLPCSLEHWLSEREALRQHDNAGNTLDLILDCDAPNSLGEFAARSPDPAAISMLIGPEGGFSDEERIRAQASGFQPVRLGPRVLRAETAAVAAMACVQMQWGDLT